MSIESNVFLENIKFFTATFLFKLNLQKKMIKSPALEESLSFNRENNFMFNGTEDYYFSK